jgi:3-hydroxybutyryl-CoA dehydrogenase
MYLKKNEKVCILGCRASGRGIAQICAENGLKVKLYDLNSNLLKNGLNLIEESISHTDKGNKNKKNRAKTIISRITGTYKIKEAVKDSDIVIETFPEDLELKSEVLAEADRFAPKDTILTTNTLFHPITDIASSIQRKDKLIGVYWCYPPQKMKLIIIIKGVLTSKETYNHAILFSKKLRRIIIPSEDPIGKRALLRLICAFSSEAMRCIEDSVASIKEIDDICKYGLNFPLGPLEMADSFGLDDLNKVIEKLYNTTGYPRFRPPSLLNKMIGAERLGVKSGKGFYDYEEKDV